MYGKRQESGLTDIIPLMCILTLWGQYPAFSHPESPQGAPLGATAVGEGLMVQPPLFTDTAGDILHPQLITVSIISINVSN